MPGRSGFWPMGEHSASLPVVAALARLLAQPGGFGRLSDRRLRLALDVPANQMPPRPAADPEVRAVVITRLQANDHDGFQTMLRDWDLGRAADPHGRRKSATAVSTALHLLTDPGIWQAQLARAPDDPWRAVMAALALPAGNMAGARRLLDPFEPAEYASPLLAAAQYQLTSAADDAAALADAFDDWADLDPGDPAVWLGHSRRLLARLPDAAGQIAALATRCEWQTARWFGQGGYAMVLLPLLGTVDLWPRVDPAQLAASALDLARHQRRDQYEVNRIAAMLSRLLPLAPLVANAALRQGYRHVLEQVLHEVIPAAWDLPLAETRRAIAAAFIPELRAGAVLHATAAGLTPCLRSAA